MAALTASSADEKVFCCAVAAEQTSYNANIKATAATTLGSLELIDLFLVSLANVAIESSVNHSPAHISVSYSNPKPDTSNLLPAAPAAASSTSSSAATSTAP